MSSKKADRLEKKVAKDFAGGSRQIASGALPFWKHDIDSDIFLIEHKYLEPTTEGFRCLAPEPERSGPPHEA